MSKRVAARSAGGVEYRTVPLGDTQVSDSGQMTGLAVRFDSPTMIGDPDWGFRESFAPGAFTKTLAESDLVLLDNHDTAKPIARKSAGTLQAEQSDGLRWKAEPTSKASYINDVRENIDAKNYGGCSFGFRSVKEDWLDDDGNRSDSWSGTQRVVREAQLFEISVCTFPAYGDTEVMTRDAVAAVRGEYRAKYDADQLKQMLSKGEAFKNANGEPSYPIADEEDLDNAIHAVGRGGADHDAIRKYIIGRAKALGLSVKIPDSWGADGSVSESKSAVVDTDTRDDPDGKEYAVIDEAIEYLNDGDSKAALRVLQANKDSRSSVIPQPEDSTAEPFDLRIYKFRLESSKPKDDE